MPLSAEPNEFHFELLLSSGSHAAGRHVREVAHPRGKIPSQEDEHGRADSPSRRQLRQSGLRPPTFLWRRFFRLLSVNEGRFGAEEFDDDQAPDLTNLDRT